MVDNFSTDSQTFTNDQGEEISVVGYPPEAIRNQMYGLQSISFAYYIALIILLTYQVTTKPRIKDSLRYLKCEKMKYWCIWGPFLVVVCLC